MKSSKGEYHLQKLVALIEKMKPAEIIIAKRFIQAFETNLTSNKGMTYSTFEFLIKKPNVTYEKLKKKINPDIDVNSFNKLLKRLYSKLLESLILSVNVNRKDAYSNVVKNKIDIRKKILEARVILGRGLETEAMELFDSIIKSGESYELYDELIEVLHYRSFTSDLMNGTNQIQENKDRIQHYRNCAEAVEKSSFWYYKYYSQQDHKGNRNKKVGLLTEAIADLQHRFKETGSANVGYFLYRLMVEYYLAHEEYTKAHDVLVRIQQLLENNIAIYMKRRMSHVHSNLADVELMLHRFDMVKNSVNSAIQHYDKESYDYILSKQIMFLASFFLKEMDEASQLIDDLLLNPQLEKLDYQKSKTQYYKSSVMFYQGDFKESYWLLNDLKSIAKDKEGWNINIRILSLMNLIELGRFDQVEYGIENLRKFIEKHGKEGNIRKRNEMIFKVFVELERSSFDFKHCFENCREELFELADPTSNLSWEIKSPELIIFDQWFMSKVNNVDYDMQIDDLKFIEKEQEDIIQILV